MEKGKFKVISLEEALKAAQTQKYEVIDLRESEEYKKGHIFGAINIPQASVKDIIRYSGSSTSLFGARSDKNKKQWILYCHRGSYSFRLARQMALEGYEVMAVVGGYREK